MKARHLLSLFVSVALTFSVGAQSDGFAELAAEDAKEVPAPTSAEELLAHCRACLPAEPVRLTGWVRRLRARGKVVQEVNLEAHLDWGASIPTVQYTFSKPSGELLSRATFRHAAGPTEVVYQTGPTLDPAVTPEWNSPLHETDLTWLDASMDFLHWTNAKLVGEASVRGRLCDLVELYPPQEIPGCQKVRLWVDRKICMFLQVQQVDENGLIQRQMWVRSVKKMGERWMVQDLEAETRNGGHRTRLHVLSCE